MAFVNFGVFVAVVDSGHKWSSFSSVKQMQVFVSPGWDTNPLQVSSHQMLVIIYLPQKDGKLS